MASIDWTVHVTYEDIGDHHILVHFSGPKIDQWFMLDLADISSKTGKTYDQIIEKLTRREEVK